MILKILGSSSSGNSYCLVGQTSSLLIEAGCSTKAIKKALDFDLSKVAGCIVTHSHSDHCKYLSDVLDLGINCYVSEETNRKLKLKTFRLPFLLTAKKASMIGEFKIMPFYVKHDVACFGFLIQHPECGKVVFLTDTHFSPFTFSGLNNIIIEANYCEHILEERHLAGKIHPMVRERVLRSHMNIQTLRTTLLANDLSKVNNIVLIHLSDGNANAAQFKKDIEDLTGKTVTIADKNVSINFDQSPF